MKTLQLSENLYYVGVIDHSLKVFDVAMPTKYGSSYNSYLLKTSEGAIVFEGSKHGFEEEYLEHISSIVDFKDIKYVVVAHTEPDHSGAIEALLEKNPDITVLASPAGTNNLKNILRHPFKSMVITAGKELKVGQYTLQFVSGLFLHWPDVMFTYIKEEKAIVTCDAFGAHYASDDILLSKEKNLPAYQEAFEYYFASIMSPYASFAIQGADRVDKLDVKIILTGHGPVIDTRVKETVAAFRDLGKKYLPSNDEKHVTLVYASCYGYTEGMAKALKEKLEADGKEVSFYKIDALNYAKVKPQILASIRTSGLVLFGTPTILQDAICLFYDLASSLPIPVIQNKKASVFGDYGWSGEAVNNLSQFLAIRKFKVIPGYRYSFKVDEAGLKGLEDYYQTLK